MSIKAVVEIQPLLRRPPCRSADAPTGPTRIPLAPPTFLSKAPSRPRTAGRRSVIEPLKGPTSKAPFATGPEMDAGVKPLKTMPSKILVVITMTKPAR